MNDKIIYTVLILIKIFEQFIKSHESFDVYKKICLNL